MTAAAALLATGKHDLRGWRRPRDAGPIGLKLHLRLAAHQRRALAGHVELVVFSGGYAGLQRVEVGSPICASSSTVTVSPRSGATGARSWRACRICSAPGRCAGCGTPGRWPIAGMPYGWITDRRGLDGAGLSRWAIRRRSFRRSPAMAWPWPCTRRDVAAAAVLGGHVARTVPSGAGGGVSAPRCVSPASWPPSPLCRPRSACWLRCVGWHPG